MAAAVTGVMGACGAKPEKGPTGRPDRRAASTTSTGEQYRPWHLPIPARVARFNEPAAANHGVAASVSSANVTSSHRQTTVPGVASWSTNRGAA